MSSTKESEPQVTSTTEESSMESGKVKESTEHGNTSGAEEAGKPASTERGRPQEREHNPWEPPRSESEEKKYEHMRRVRREQQQQQRQQEQSPMETSQPEYDPETADSQALI